MSGVATDLALEVRKIAKSYGSTHALRGVAHLVRRSGHARGEPALS